MADLSKQLASLGVTPITPELQKKLASLGVAPAGQPALDDYKPTPGAGEALVRGLEQGATLGFGDEINGGLEALLDSISGKGKEKSFLDLYRQHRDESRANFKAAEDAHPYISGGANLAGSLLPAALLPVAGLAGEGLAGAAKVGAAYGAVQGLGNSDADLVSNPLGAAGDVTKGAASGAILGTAVKAGADKIGNTLSKFGSTAASEVAGGAKNLGQLDTLQNTLDAFKQGLGGTPTNPEGRVLVGKAPRAKAAEEFIKFLGQSSEGEPGSVSGLLRGEANKALDAKKDILTSGKSIDMMPWLKDFNQAFTNAGKKFGGFEADANDLQKVADFVTNYFESKGTTKLPLDEAELFMRRLGALGSEGDQPLNTAVGKSLVNRLVSPLEGRSPNQYEEAFKLPETFSPLKEAINSVDPELAPLNDRIHGILSAQGQTASLADQLNLANDGKVGVGAKDRVQSFLKQLPDDLRAQVEPKMNDLAKAQDIAQKIAAPGLSDNFLTGTAKGLAYMGANYAGAATRAIYNLMPEELSALSSKLAASGSGVASGLAKVLSEAANKDDMGRKALLFAIQQNPTYRQLLAQHLDANPAPHESASK